MLYLFIYFTNENENKRIYTRFGGPITSREKSSAKRRIYCDIILSLTQIVTFDTISRTLIALSSSNRNELMISEKLLLIGFYPQCLNVINL